MPAYIVVGASPKNSDMLKRYQAAAGETLAKYSGKILAKGPVEQLHGTFDYKMQIILSFPCKEDALNWYHSPEYQALLKVRNEGMESQFQLIA